MKDLQNYLQRYFYQSSIKPDNNSHFSLGPAGVYGRREFYLYLDKDYLEIYNSLNHVFIRPGSVEVGLSVAKVFVSGA